MAHLSVISYLFLGIGASPYSNAHIAYMHESMDTPASWNNHLTLLIHFDCIVDRNMDSSTVNMVGSTPGDCYSNSCQRFQTPEEYVYLFQVFVQTPMGQASRTKRWKTSSLRGSHSLRTVACEGPSLQQFLSSLETVNPGKKIIQMLS